MMTTEIESRRLSEQILLDQRKSLSARNRWGQFATPPQLALDIAKYARILWEEYASIDCPAFLDPAIGTGAFYSAFLQAFDDPSHIATGIELDPLFARAASSIWANLPLTIEQADFTDLSPQRKFNLILTNPPYVRHHHLESKEKDRLRALVKSRLGLPISGLAGLYCYFLLLADSWLAPDGLSVWLIPSEFMAVNYGAAVKEYLLRHVSLVQIHRFSPGDVQFSDALVSSAIVVFRKRPPTRTHRVRFSFGGLISNPTQFEDVGASDLDIKSKWTQFAERSPRVEPTIQRLGDLFTIKRGLATGDNSFFIVAREKLAELGIPDKYVRPILPSPRYVDADVIEADENGYPLLSRQLGLIDCPLSEEVIRDRHPEFFAYLEKGKHSGVSNGYLASRRIPWYSQERRPPAPFLCTYMGRAIGKRRGSPFRFLWNKSSATAANVYLLLYPKPSLANLLMQSSDLEAQVYNLLSETTSDLFLRESRVYGGGLHKLEPSELSQLDVSAIAKKINLPVFKKQRNLFDEGA